MPPPPPLSTSRDWADFFSSSGVPSAAAREYADRFERNRIRGDMLDDLDKELLRELGVTVIGDVISILKFAKKVSKGEADFGVGNKAKKDSSSSSSSLSSASSSLQEGRYKGKAAAAAGQKEKTLAASEAPSKSSKTKVSSRLGPPKQISFSSVGEEAAEGKRRKQQSEEKNVFDRLENSRDARESVSSRRVRITDADEHDDASTRLTNKRGEIDSRRYEADDYRHRSSSGDKRPMSGRLGARGTHSLI